jgi:hypothetical protein
MTNSNLSNLDHYDTNSEGYLTKRNILSAIILN